MNKSSLLLSVLAFVLGSGAVRASESSFSPGGNLQVFLPAGAARLALESSYRFDQPGSRHHRRLAVGMRFEALRFGNFALRAGGDLFREYGNRYSSDWVGGTELWANTNGRAETGFSVLLLPRLLVGSSWMTELKLEWDGRLEDKRSLARIVPGLTWMPSSRWSIRARGGAYLNLESGSVYERVTYLGTLFEVSPGWQVGPALEIAKTFWRVGPLSKSRSEQRIGATLNLIWAP